MPTCKRLFHQTRIGSRIVSWKRLFVCAIAHASNAYILLFVGSESSQHLQSRSVVAPQYPHFLTGYPKTTLPFDSCLLGLITRQSSFSFSRYSFDFREAHSKHSYQMFPLGDSNMCVAVLEQSKSAQVESIRTLGRCQSIFNMWLDNLSLPNGRRAQHQQTTCVFRRVHWYKA